MAFEFFKKLKKKLFQSSLKSINESQTSDSSLYGDKLKSKKNNSGDIQKPKITYESPSNINNKGQPFQVNIGIDFGTRYSKICVRGPSDTKVSICSKNTGNVLDATVPSIIFIDKNGVLSLPTFGTPEDSKNNEVGKISYLKMALVKQEFLVISDVSDQELIKGIKNSINALAAFYLAHLIDLAKQWVYEHWAKDIGKNEVIFSSNIGVPVEHLDNASMKKKFANVFAVAWEWGNASQVSTILQDIEENYKLLLKKVNIEKSYCQPVPEIKAAVDSFATSREARKRIYIFFDIGGGTLDGVAFHIHKDDGEVKVNFLSGKVQNLGVMVLAKDIKNKVERNSNVSLNEIANNVVFDELKISSDIESSVNAFKSKIHDFVGYIINSARQKQGLNWLKDLIKSSDLPTPYFVPIKEKDIRPLPVFVGGGGSTSKFYCDAIAETYHRRSHKNYGIPPYGLTKIPKPKELDLGALSSSEYHRFLIAFGLSIRFGESPDFTLPSEHEPIARPDPDDIRLEFDQYGHNQN